MAVGGKAAFVGGMVLGAVVAPIVMFSAAWIVTSGAEHANAERAADAALVAHLTLICVQQFSKDTISSAASASAPRNRRSRKSFSAARTRSTNRTAMMMQRRHARLSKYRTVKSPRHRDGRATASS
jgi:hypothetical protein